MRGFLIPVIALFFKGMTNRYLTSEAQGMKQASECPRAREARLEHHLCGGLMTNPDDRNLCRSIASYLPRKWWLTWADRVLSNGAVPSRVAALGIAPVTLPSRC